MAQVCHRLSVACSTATGDEYVRALTLTRLSGDVTHTGCTRPWATGTAPADLSGTLAEIQRLSDDSRRRKAPRGHLGPPKNRAPAGERAAASRATGTTLSPHPRSRERFESAHPGPPRRLSARGDHRALVRAARLPATSVEMMSATKATRSKKIHTPVAQVVKASHATR
jgi:hypothetical protein